MQLQHNLHQFTKAGIAVFAISYDSVEAQAAFAGEFGITYSLLSDADHQAIEATGILNTLSVPEAEVDVTKVAPFPVAAVEEGLQESTYGIPYPGTFLLDPAGRVTARFFEAAYQERSTVSSIAVRLGDAIAGTADRAATRVTTDHLEALAWATDDVVAPGNRLSFVVDVTPKTDMHVYAPGDHSYRVIRLRLTAPDFLRSHEVSYPASQTYRFEPLDETVPVYEQPFRLVQDVTIPMRRDVDALASEPDATLRVEGVLEYQACDHEVCYLPAEAPLSWELDWRPLVRD